MTERIPLRRTAPSAPVEFEYGIVYHPGDEEPHRWGMTQPEAEKWRAEWIHDGANPERCLVIRRALGPWELLDNPSLAGSDRS